MKYSAEDFENAKFAEHEDGRIAMRVNPHLEEPWESLEDYHSDANMVHNGWVPVSTKPTITESEFDEIRTGWGKIASQAWLRGFTKAGGEIIPDPEPTNAEKLEQLYSNWSQSNLNPPFGEWADSVGVKAPEEWGKE